MNSSSATLETLQPFQAGCPWYDEIQRFGDANIKWCEERVCAFINEPVNAWSNLAYIAVGLWILTRNRQFGIMTLLVGIFSFIFHATNFYLTQIFDYLGMYLVVAQLLTMNLVRLSKIKVTQFYPVFLGLIAFMLVLLQAMRMAGYPYQLIVLLGVVLIIWTEFRCKDRYASKSLPAAVFFFALGVTTLLLDKTRVVCDPKNIFLQGHSYWHLFSALSIGCIYLHYERILNKAPFSRLKT
jgi:hypothetical protein